MRMSDRLTELEELREATRVRITPEVAKGLRDLAECYELAGNRGDRQLGHGLSVLLDMHDKLEALRNG